MVKLPRIEHLKIVKAHGREYAYFATGVKVDGKPQRVRCKHPSQPGFWDQYAALMAGRKKRAAPTYTVADLARDYMRSKEFAAKALNTQRSYIYHLSIVEKLWPDAPAGELESSDIAEAIEASDWGAGTHNMVLAVLGIIYKWGRQNKSREVRKCDPVKDVDRRKDLGKHDAWPEDVLDAALEDAALRLPVHLMAFTGLRIGDALALRWGQIKGGEITVTPEKTKRFGKTLHIPLAAALREELDRTPRAGLTILHGYSEGHLRRMVAKFGAGFGVHIKPHGLRTNAVESLLLAGCSVAEVAAITGHSYKMVEHYAAKINTRKMGQAAIVKLDRSRARNA